MSVHDNLVADGSAVADARRITIDRSDPTDRYRYRCPNGHVSWDRTNSHIWCPSCRRQAETGDDVDPEHWELFDAKTGECIGYARVRFVQE
jgi:5-methylcytosine-specific restriction endonuclease McrA